MATFSALSPKIVQAVGAFTPIATGVAGGSGTTTVVTIPQFKSVLSAVVTGLSTTTAMYIATVSANTFTVTHGSGEKFAWMAYGNARI